MNLETARPDKNLLTGSGVHEALAHAYPVGEAFSPEEMLVHYHFWATDQERAIQASNNLGDTLKRSILDEIALGAEVVNHYSMWAARYEKQGPDELRIAEVLATEVRLEVPLFQLGSCNLYLEATADAYIRTASGMYCLMEHKTAARFPDVNLLYMDEQCTGYLWAAQVDPAFAEHPPSSVIFNFLKKKAPTMPRQLLDGSLSQNKNIACSFEAYLSEIHRLGLDPNDYRDFLLNLFQAPSEFFLRCRVEKSDAALSAFGRSFIDTVAEMASPDVLIYPAPEWYKCQYCPFKEPCQMIMEGVSPGPILRTEYQKRSPRWPEVSLEE
jgi:hypothetical protein